MILDDFLKISSIALDAYNVLSPDDPYKSMLGKLFDEYSKNANNPSFNKLLSIQNRLVELKKMIMNIDSNGLNKIGKSVQDEDIKFITDIIEFTQELIDSNSSESPLDKSTIKHLNRIHKKWSGNIDLRYTN